MGVGGPPGPANGRGCAANTTQWARPARPAFFEALGFPRNHFEQRRPLTARGPSGVRAGGPGGGAGRGCPQEFPRGRPRGRVKGRAGGGCRMAEVEARPGHGGDAGGRTAEVGAKPGPRAEARVGSWRSGRAGPAAGFRSRNQGSGMDAGVRPHGARPRRRPSEVTAGGGGGQGSCRRRPVAPAGRPPSQPVWPRFLELRGKHPPPEGAPGSMSGQGQT